MTESNGANIETTELMCVGGPLHGSLAPRGQLLQFEYTMPKNPHAPNPKFLDERHTYVLSSFDYSPETQIKFWRHKPLDMGRAAQFVMLDFLVNRPSLRLAAAFACVRAIESAATMRPVIPSRELLQAIKSIFPPKPKGEDPQP